MTNVILEPAGVSKMYGEEPTEVHALRDVDLTVATGELVAIMGPSGSGKSTLLTIAVSLEEPTQGQVTINGGVLSSTSRNERAALRRRSLGYVFQDFNLLAGLTAKETPTSVSPARTSITSTGSASSPLVTWRQP